MTAYRVGFGKPWIGLAADMTGTPATPPGILFMQTDTSSTYVADTAGNWQTYPSGGGITSIVLTTAAQSLLSVSTTGATSTIGVIHSGTGANFWRDDGTFSNTITGPFISSYVGTASTPAVKLTGQPYAGTGTTSFPLVYINDSGATASTTLNTAGTYLGVNASGVTLTPLNLMVNGASYLVAQPAAALAAKLSVGANYVGSGATASGAGTLYLGGTSLAGTATNSPGGNASYYTGLGTGNAAAATHTFYVNVPTSSGTGAQSTTTAFTLGYGTGAPSSTFTSYLVTGFPSAAISLVPASGLVLNAVSVPAQTVTYITTSGVTITSQYLVNLAQTTFTTALAAATVSLADTFRAVGPTVGGNVTGTLGIAGDFVAGSGFGTNYAARFTGATLFNGTLSANLINSTRWQSRVLLATDGTATPTLDTDNYDEMRITAQAEAITNFSTNLTGTPNDGDILIVSLTDSGTARAITWGSKFESSGTVLLPTTTVVSTRLDVTFIWNAVTSAWRCIGAA